MGETLREYCLRYGREELLLQWDHTQNMDLTPDSVTYGSRRKIWWICDMGHRWQSSPSVRTEKGSGCPYCAGKKVAPGLDFASLYPYEASQWHPNKNGKANPCDVLPGSHKTAWWICGQGHEWKAAVRSRARGDGCPVCAGRTVVQGINDLQTTAPILAKQWHPARNGDLKPTQVTGGTGRKVWWICDRGHEWQATINSRVEGNDCPVCAGKVVIPGENDLESYDPELARQWCAERNGNLLPNQVSVYSNRQVWWRCERGHEWKNRVSARTFHLEGCPYCNGKRVLAGFNDLATLEPLVAKQWHPTLNAPLEPEMVMSGCRKKVWWRCAEGHEWKAVIYSRTGAQKCGCPICAGRSPRKYYDGKKLFEKTEVI